MKFYVVYILLLKKKVTIGHQQNGELGRPKLSLPHINSQTKQNTQNPETLQTNFCRSLGK